MTAAIIVILLIAIIATAIVVAAPRMSGRNPGQRSSRRPGADGRPAESRFRGGRHQPADERTLLAEGEQIQRRVEAQVARDRADAHHRFRLTGRAEAARLARHPEEPIAPGFVPLHPADAPYPHPADGYGDPRGRPPRAGILPDDESVELELRAAAARARVARIASEDQRPPVVYGRRRMWSGRPRRAPQPLPGDPRDDRFVP